MPTTTKTQRGSPPPHGMLGRCPELRRALEVARRFARSDAPVVISGPTGSGKELMARHIHRCSHRRRGPFVVVDCPNLPDNLVEDELFGHERGAFTGAGRAKGGLIEEACGGTLFLDEVGELPLEMQSKLLRFLQEGTTKRIGANERIRVDVRVVAASWRDLGRMVREGTFREDLYHRLAWGLVDLPPLRDRGHDIVLLARHVLTHSKELAGCRKGLKRDAAPVLLAHDWPGNVRELQRVMFRAAMLGRGRRVSGADIAAVLDPDSASVEMATASMEDRILDALGRGECGAGDLAHALGVSRSHLQRALAPMVRQRRLLRVHQSSATRYCLPGPRTLAADPRWAVALQLIAMDGRLTRSDLAARLGVSARTASRVITGLLGAGLVAPDGRAGKHQGYVRSDACAEASAVLPEGA